MMQLNVKHQETYSRGELILRSFFGALYIALPHMFLLGIYGIWGAILRFIAWWTILFTGRYPQSYFEFHEKMLRWNLRVTARLYNLSDDYPAFGLEGTDDFTDLKVEYPEELSRGKLLLKTFFGAFYVILPHAFILVFRMIWGAILSFLAFWSVLFTGGYPESWHTFNVETIRWATRVNLYMGFMTDEYPPFSGKPDAIENSPVENTPLDESPVDDTPVDDNPELNSPDRPSES